MTEIEDKPTLLRLPLNLDSTFVHKPDQIELQLDQFQPLYSENLGLVVQEATQPNITKRPAIGDNMTIEVTICGFWWEREGHNSAWNSINKTPNVLMPKENSLFLYCDFY